MGQKLRRRTTKVPHPARDFLRPNCGECFLSTFPQRPGYAPWKKAFHLQYAVRIEKREHLQDALYSNSLILRTVSKILQALFVEMDATPLSLVRVGYVMMAKPKHFDPRPPNSTTIGQHPVVVLTGPDGEGKVKVASMSHRHPDNPPQRSASYYNLPVDPVKGEGTISTGVPKIIHFSQLKPTNPQTAMSAHDFARLKNDILQNCPGYL